MTIDAGVPLKVVVAGFEREQWGAITATDVGDIAQALAHVIGQRDIATLELAPDELHTIGLARILVSGHFVDNPVVVDAHDAAASLHEHIARLTMTIEDKRFVPDGVANDMDGVTAGAQIMHLDVLVVITIITTDVAIDDLVVLNVDFLMPISRVKADIQAAGSHIIDIELVVPHVEIAGVTAIITLLVVGHQGEQHAAVSLGILLVLSLVITVMELVILDEDVGAVRLAALIAVGHVNHAVINA